MGLSQDYQNIPDWVAKSEGYQTGAMVKYQGNIFYANFWASEPGVGDADHNGWRFYDELYDQTPHTPTAQAKIIAYIPTWRKKEGFNYANDEMYQYITHGIIAFLMFSEINLGEFDPKSVDDVNAIISDVVNTGHRNGTRILIALGGATDYGFLNLMTSIGNDAGNPLLDQAVQNVVNFVNSNNLDGVDLDLECWWDKNGNASNDQGGRIEPHPAGRGLTEFARKLREAMPDQLISAAFFASSWYGNNYQLIDYVDWIGVMTYDLTGSWNNSPVGPHSALNKIRDQKVYEAEQQGSWPLPNSESTSSDPMKDNPIQSVEEALWYWTNPFYVNWQGAGQRMPRNKFVGGVPLYGYDFAYQKDPDDLSGQVPPGYKTITYKNILAQFPEASTANNGNIKVPGSTPRPPFISASGNYPYAHNIYFETPDTAVTKLNFLKDVGAQGVIIWELSNDVWEEGKSIIKALYENSGNPKKEPNIALGQQSTSSLSLELLNKNKLIPQTDWISPPHISGDTISFGYNISAEPYYQWWVLYQGVLPNWADFNKNKQKWDWISNTSKTDKKGRVSFNYDFTPGAIYTLALFKDQTKNAYDLADYAEFLVPPKDDEISNPNISGNTISFGYNISAEPYYQWWVLYNGMMPGWADLNENKQKWDWINNTSKTDKKGRVSFNYDFTPGAIYTLALFKDQTKNAYDLADYVEFIARDNSVDNNANWIKLHGDNSYCYCACNSSATNSKQRHYSNHTMNIKAGAAYFYAVLTKDDDSIDFPTGAVLTIEGPDGTKYDHDIQEENQLVITSGSSIRCFIVKDPKPGDWKMTMTVPEGVGFHCECNTVPSKDVYDTITQTLDNSLQKRDLGISSELGWIGIAAGILVLGVVIVLTEEVMAPFVYEFTTMSMGLGVVSIGPRQVALNRPQKIQKGKAATKALNLNNLNKKETAQIIEDIAAKTTNKKEQRIPALLTWNMQGANWNDVASSPWYIVKDWFLQGNSTSSNGFPYNIVVACFQECGSPPPSLVPYEVDVNNINGLEKYFWTDLRNNLFLYIANLNHLYKQQRLLNKLFSFTWISRLI
jgi:GH18 family chitinase